MSLGYFYPGHRLWKRHAGWRSWRANVFALDLGRVAWENKKASFESQELWGVMVDIPSAHRNQSFRPNWITKLLTLGSTGRFVLAASTIGNLLRGSSFHYTMSKFHTCQVEHLECEQLMSAEDWSLRTDRKPEHEQPQAWAEGASQALGYF